MGLKGYMLWVMGQLDSTCRAPPQVVVVGVLDNVVEPRDVAMQVEGGSLLIGRHIHHSAFSLADRHFSQSDEEEVGQYLAQRAAPYSDGLPREGDGGPHRVIALQVEFERQTLNRFFT
jgi:hypothetical protein